MCMSPKSSGKAKSILYHASREYATLVRLYNSKN